MVPGRGWEWDVLFFPAIGRSSMLKVAGNRNFGHPDGKFRTGAGSFDLLVRSSPLRSGRIYSEWICVIASRLSFHEPIGMRALALPRLHLGKVGRWRRRASHAVRRYLIL